MKFTLGVYFAIKRLLRKINLGFVVLRFPRDFEGDGLFTSRARSFESDLQFLKAKSATVEELGRDFCIDWRTHTFLWALKTSRKVSKHGAWIELGTGKAWMFTFAKHYFEPNFFPSTFLLDRFSEHAVDAISGQTMEHLTHESYISDPGGEITRLRFRELPVEVIPCELPDGLSSLTNRGLRFSFVHVDLNAAQPEVDSLRILWPQIDEGGLVLLDDFGSPEFSASRKSMEALSAEIGFHILCLPTGQGLVIKGKGGS